MADSTQADSINHDTGFILCSQEPQTMKIYFSYVIPAISVLSMIALLIFMAFFFRAYNAKTLQIKKGTFYTTTVFFIVILLNFICWTLMDLNYCQHVQDTHFSNVFTPLSLLLVNIKTILLVAILFYTVKSVFNGTPFAISKCTTRFFLAVFTIICLLAVFAAILFARNNQIMAFSITGASSTLLMLFCIYLIVLFITKLLKTYRAFRSSNDKETNQQFVAIITKISLLFTLAVFTRILVTVMHALLTRVINAEFTMFVNLLTMLDFHMSFFCVFLSFRHFDAVYTRMCGICDKACHRCWSGCVGASKDEIMTMKGIEVIESATVDSPSVTSADAVPAVPPEFSLQTSCGVATQSQSALSVEKQSTDVVSV